MAYIKREALIESFHNVAKGVGDSPWTIEAIEAMINRQEAADVAPVVRGRWEEKFFTNDRQRVCSICHCTVRQPSYDKGETALFKYCPHCGARMDGE